VIRNMRTLLVIASTCAIFGSARTAEGERKEVVVVGSNHAHSVEVLSVTVTGRVDANGKKLGVTAKFSETEAKLERLTIVMPDGKSVVVPPSYFEKIRLPRPDSLSLGYIMAGDSGTVGGILVFLDFGDLRRRADLRCAKDVGDPLFEGFSLFYDTRARTFESRFTDHCGEPVER